MAHTECHLVKAAYGPPFHREVTINNPADRGAVVFAPTSRRGSIRPGPVLP